MKRVLLLLLLCAGDLFSTEKLTKYVADQILSELEDELIRTKGNKNRVKKLLYREIFTNGSPRSCNLVNYMLRDPGSAELRHNLDLALSQIARMNLENNHEIEKALAKILVAIIGSPGSLNYLAPTMRKYEEKISQYVSTELAKFKAVSFFCSQIISTVMLEKIKRDEKMQNKDLYKIVNCLIAKLKNNVVTDGESKVSQQIHASLWLLNDIFNDQLPKVDESASSGSKGKNNRHYLGHDEFNELFMRYISNGQAFRDLSFLYSYHSLNCVVPRLDRGIQGIPKRWTPRSSRGATSRC